MAGPADDLPPGWALTAADDPGHPWVISGGGHEPLGCEDKAMAIGLAWRLYAEALAAGHQPAPHPAPVGLVRALCALVGGQRAAWRILRLNSDRTIRKWCLGESEASHAAIELLRMHAGGRAP